MMRITRGYLENSLGLGATSGTKSFDLPKSGMLSDLLIRFYATNGANANKENPIHDKVKKIEVLVDGSTVVKSLTGKEARMLARFNAGVMPADDDSELATTDQWMSFPIHFGRFPGDLKYGLDCGRYVNPQLKITWDTTGAGLDATSLFSTSSYPILDVLATQVIEGPGFPGGHIRSHRLITHTFSSNDEEKRVELPLGNVIRRLVLWCDEDVGYWWYSRIAKVHLDLNIGERQPFKMDAEELLQYQRQLHGVMTTQRKIDFEAGDQHRDTRLHNTRGCSFSPINATTFTSGHDGGSAHKWRFYLRKTLDNGLAVGAIWGELLAVGDLFLGAVDIPFDVPNEDFMLDTKKWTDVDLVVQAGPTSISTIAPEMGVLVEEIIP